MEENNEKEYLQIKRYFVEVDVNKHGSAQLYRYSGWVVINKKNGTETICKPKGYDWDKNEKIYLITPVKNQARWIRFMVHHLNGCLLYTSPSPRDKRQSRMPSSA